MIEDKTEKKHPDWKEGNLALAKEKNEKAKDATRLTEIAKELMTNDGKTLENMNDLIPYLALADEILKRENKNCTIKNIKLDNYMDNVEQFHFEQPFFYDKNNLFWWWNNTEQKYEIIDDTDLMNLIDKELQFGGQTVSGGIKNNYMEAFKRVGRKHLPKETSKNWIQFKSKIYDLQNKTIMEADPKYFICNPIPHNIGTSDETPTIDKLFCEWVGEENKEMLYEIIAYCCLTDYPIHTLFALIGSGRNGKSRYLELINRFIGKHNITSTELDNLLENRFESAKLYKKLVCSVGETNFGTLKRTSLIKKLTGGDLIGFEFKNKNPFDDYNYAKILISSNSLPSSEDTSEGFYRRWIIINFPNNFPEGKDILKTIPEQEYDNLASKIIPKLNTIIDKGKFTNQGTIEERQKKYIAVSNPLKIFIEENCDLAENNYIKYNELYNEYVQYLTKNKHRIISKREFSASLTMEGFLVERTSKKVNDEFVASYWVYGLDMKKENMRVMRVVHDISISSYIREADIKHEHNPHNPHNPTWEDCMSILLDRVDGEIPFDALIKLGFDEALLRKWIGEGLLYEPRCGFLRSI